MTSFESYKWIFHNGRFLPAELAKVPVTNHALNFGSAVFDTLRFYKAGIDTLAVGVKMHLNRLALSVNSIGLSPLNMAEVENSLEQFITKNNVTEGYLRIIAYADGPCNSIDISGVTTAFSIFGWYVNCPRFLQPISLNISYFRRPNPASTLPRAKVCGLYALDVVSQNNAKYLRHDTALFLNEDGTVCEVAGANLFIIKDSIIYTPIINNSINGITASVILDLADSVGIKLERTGLTIDDLFDADEVFITGTFYGIRPVSRIDKIQYHQSGNNITNLLNSRFEEMLDNQGTPLNNKWISRYEKKHINMESSPVIIQTAAAGDEEFIVWGTRELLRELRNIKNAPEIKGIHEAYKALVNSSSLDKIFIAVSNKGEKCGFITLSEQSALHCGGPYLTIQELWVKPEFRHHGIGTLLIINAEKYCNDCGITRIDVGLPDYAFHGFTATYDFYKKNGYLDIGVRMKKALE